jgi:hypothetical protein
VCTTLSTIERSAETSSMTRVRTGGRMVLRREVTVVVRSRTMASRAVVICGTMRDVTSVLIWDTERC